MEIHQSAEDYLETILILKERSGQVRSIDIATEMNYTKPSISVAMKKLRENGYIQVDKDGFITLTKSGYEIASNIYTRHKVLTDFFISLGVNAKTADEDACKIEHDLSEETFEKIREHAEKASHRH
ncbi:MAG: metal-dependent transcriptional regulator [Lachnospiraceae bacterium]|nr:metal-dependent transcriptional regulator [Lachnospiraceae bacterium]